MNPNTNTRSSSTGSRHSRGMSACSILFQSSRGVFKFIDSFQSTHCSLDKLTQPLSEENLVHTKKHFGDNWELVKQKGVYPYEYFDSFDRLDETELPPIEKFYSSSNGERITEEGYKHAQNVWKEFECEDLWDYHDIYLASDVTLLVDAFELFRATSMKAYKLDPVHYYTAPVLHGTLI